MRWDRSIVACALLVAIALEGVGASAQRRGAPAATAWTGRAGQPSQIEVMAIQRTMGPSVQQCFAPHAVDSGYRIDVVFDTSGRPFWSSVDAATGAREHCLATAVRREMRLQPFPATSMLRIRFPLAGSHW
jgi:hypothetical protein